MFGHNFNSLVREQLRFNMRRLLLLFSIGCLCLACPNEKDTCSILGNTFVSIELDTSTIGLSLMLETLDTLTETYFETATLVRLKSDHDGNPFNNLAEGSSINLSTSDRLNIRLPDPNNEAEEVGLSIRYPDRQDFINCEHSGSGDQYVLFLFFNYLPDGRFEDFRWIEDFRPGGF